MKRVLVLSSIAFALTTTLFAQDANETEAASAEVVQEKVAFTAGDAQKGAAVYKRCIACHGQKAELQYLKKVPPLNTLEPAQMVEDMLAYKVGEIGGGKGRFNMGAVMKGQMAPLSKEDMENVAAYIETLK
ncbi:c-type cytochrome [uncultured Campylobacter sp.]|uniref:c-type cytochrome n=1 Tax=uncultured Campylobacter sp. TaxID=218934 RepID=UPI002612C890|nr:c-type cytochrome [uncultured Campylobacter sp.]